MSAYLCGSNLAKPMPEGIRRQAKQQNKMYFATEIQPILDAMEAKKPRSLRDLYTDYYGGAIVFDRNDRGHAPFDGYQCPETTRVYRGGEYLAIPPDENGHKPKSNRPPKVTGATFWINNEPVYVSGTKSQRTAGAEVAKAQMFEHDKLKSHVGAVGKRSDFYLFIVAIFEEETAYGQYVGREYVSVMSYTHECRDEFGNRIVYKGSKKLGEADGRFLTFKATVKSHYITKDGRKITYIQRPTDPESIPYQKPEPINEKFVKLFA